MSATQLRQYIDMVNNEWESAQLYEMARVGPQRHGIDNVIIWVGEAPKNHGLRVKVSNIPNKMRMEDSFTIMMPSLDYDPTQVADWITPKIMKKILNWIVLNQELLYNYENGKISDTDTFMDQISKV